MLESQKGKYDVKTIDLAEDVAEKNHEAFKKKVEVNLRYYSYLHKEFIHKMSSNKFQHKQESAPKNDDFWSCKIVYKRLKKVTSIIKNFYQIGLEKMNRVRQPELKSLDLKTALGDQTAKTQIDAPSIFDLEGVLQDAQRLVASYNF